MERADSYIPQLIFSSRVFEIYLKQQVTSINGTVLLEDTVFVLEGG